MLHTQRLQFFLLHMRVIILFFEGEASLDCAVKEIRSGDSKMIPAEISINGWTSPHSEATVCCSRAHLPGSSGPLAPGPWICTS